MLSSINKGSFGAKIIYYSSIPSVHKKNVFFYLHGVFSSGFNPKKKEFFTKIADEFGEIFYYETSRNKYVVKNENKDLDFEEYILSFKGKSFEDELNDVLTIFDLFYRNLPSDINIHLIAASLGGTLSSYLIPKYKNIKSITLLGSGISTKGINNPITSSYPESSKILDNFKRFRGKLTLIQGTLDTVVPREGGKEIIKVAKLAKSKELIELPGVNHTFDKKFGQEDLTILNNEIFEIIRHQVE